MTASEYKSYKGIRKENLRDNMTDLEVVLTDLGEIATRELAKKRRPKGLKQNEKIGKINIIINYQVKSFKELFDECKCIESINFKQFNRKYINTYTIKNKTR